MAGKLPAELSGRGCHGFHDRYFIDETAEIVYELTDKKLVRYVGNYTQFRQQKLKNLAIWKKQYEAAAGRIGTTESAGRAFQAQTEKAAFARSRKKIDRAHGEIAGSADTGRTYFYRGTGTCGDGWQMGS